MKYDFILASASPRRREILSAGGYEFTVMPSDVEEPELDAPPGEMVMKLARLKAEACAAMLESESTQNSGEIPEGCESASGKVKTDSKNRKLIIGSDTLVFLDNTRMGKPADKDEWIDFIRRMSGRKHSVITGVALVFDGRCETFYSETEVTVDEMTEAEIMQYVDYGEDMDKAGGYAIQGKFAKFIPSIEGEYNNVVGFPIAMFRRKLAELGIE